MIQIQVCAQRARAIGHPVTSPGGFVAAGRTSHSSHRTRAPGQNKVLLLFYDKDIFVWGVGHAGKEMGFTSLLHLPTHGVKELVRPGVKGIVHPGIKRRNSD